MTEALTNTMGNSKVKISRRHMIGSLVGAALIPAASANVTSDEALARELKRLIDRSANTHLKANLLIVHGAHIAGKDSELSRILAAYAQREMDRLRR